MLVLLSWGVFGLWQAVAGLICGVLLLDMAVQGALVSNQQLIYALRPDARSRINTLLMGVMFLGGAAGSSTAAWAWAAGGWNRVAVFGGAFAAGAVVLQVLAKGARQA